MSRAEVEAEQDNVEVRCVPACTLLSCLAAALIGQLHSHQPWRASSANRMCSSVECAEYGFVGSDGLHRQLASSGDDLAGLHRKQEYAGMQDVDADDSDLSSIEEGGDNDAGSQRPANSKQDPF